MKPIEHLVPDDFHYSKEPGYVGHIRAGIRHWIRTKDFGLERHECYQFDTFAAVISIAKAMREAPGMERLQIMTHRGQYKGLKAIGEWRKPAGKMRCGQCEATFDAPGYRKLESGVPWPAGEGVCPWCGSDEIEDKEASEAFITFSLTETTVRTFTVPADALRNERGDLILSRDACEQWYCQQDEAGIAASCVETVNVERDIQILTPPLTTEPVTT